MWDTLKTPGEGELEAASLTADTYWTVPVKLYDNMTSHAFQYKITGDGTATITPYTSITQQNWASNDVKLSAATKTSGPDGDGIGVVPIAISPGEFIKFKIVVASAAVALTLEFVQK